MQVHAESTVETLVRAHRTKLCAFAELYVGCPDVAEDIVQDVFVQLWMLLKGGERCRNPKRYLYTAVRNRALNHLEHERVVRKSRAMIQRAGQAPGMSQPPIPADEQLEAAELEEAFDHAVDRMPARCRETFVHHRNGGKTYAEIGAAMGTSARTAETQLARAKRFLRRDLACWL